MSPKVQSTTLPWPLETGNAQTPCCNAVEKVPVMLLTRKEIVSMTRALVPVMGLPFPTPMTYVTTEPAVIVIGPILTTSNWSRLTCASSDL